MHCRLQQKPDHTVLQAPPGSAEVALLRDNQDENGPAIMMRDAAVVL
jgi:hypothetical protein